MPYRAVAGQLVLTLGPALGPRYQLETGQMVGSTIVGSWCRVSSGAPRFGEKFRVKYLTPA